ncbi:MAG: hypothetical protein KKD35_05800 [Elusimicrobia bacterium]|nr:hypothetical protein [Elusimicrobiota bacterium]
MTKIKISNEGYVLMKVKIIALIMVLTAFNPLFAKEKDDQKSLEYYDAEKIKIVRTHQLTTEGNYRWPIWSPDGKKISADNWYGLQIFEFKENGKEIEKIGEITEMTGNNYAWSPAGDSMVYTVNEGGAAFSLWLLKIGKEKGKLKIISKNRLTSEGGVEPAWSPDGSKIVFSGGKSLMIINSDGANREVLIEGEEIWEPKFISNEEILYLKGSTKVEIKPRMFRPRDMRHLFKFNVLTHEETDLFPDDIITNFKIVLSEKHKDKMYYSLKKTGEKVVINLDMTEKYKIPVEDEYLSKEDISPDGSKFICLKVEPDWKHDDIIGAEFYIMNSDGTGLRQLTNTPDIVEGDTNWSPDGRWLLYVDEEKNNIFVSKLTRHHD